MKLHLDNAAGLNLFTGYDADYVAVNRQRYQTSLIVLPDRIVENWPPRDFAALEATHFEFILEFQPEIVLFGTGDTLRFPHPSLTEALTRAHIGIEVMNNPAACRTYNILAAEGRKVAAALLLR
ncbi:MAG: Mth938-like domain-containing protein [Betaproteobacteria bacterium]|nr:Mth938-like domain-containing protein [Betaproteobacteria bacterium]